MALPSVQLDPSPRSPPPSWQPCIFDLTIDDVRFDIEDEYDKGYNDDEDDDDSIINTFLNGFPTPKVIQQHAEKITENPMPTVQEELVHVPEIIPMPKPIQQARDSDDDDSICSAEFRHYLDGYDDSICSAEFPHDLEEHDDYYDEDDNSRSSSCDHSTDEEFDEEVGEMMSKAQSDGIGQIIHKESVECDRVSDAVLDACLTSHPKCKVARETAAKDNMVTVAGKCEVEEEEEQEERSNDKKEKKKEKQRRKRQRQRERKRNKQEEEEEEEEEEKEDGETAKKMDRAA